MSKFLKIMIVMVTILAVAAPVVIAEDRLSLSGSMRVRGFSFQEYDFDDSDDVSNGFFDQRLRIGGKLSIAEGVSITFRTDITETKWGQSGATYGSGRSGSTQQWDRAHIDITKGMVSVRAGQQLGLMGQGIAFDHQNTGLKVSLATGAPITLYYFRSDQFGSGETDDADLYGAQVSHKTDNYNAQVFGGFAHKSAVTSSGPNDEGASVYLIGVSGGFNAGPVFIQSEIDFFGGDYYADKPTGLKQDAVGIQGYVDASMPINEMFTLGGQFFYAQGQDAEDDGVQITKMGNGFNGWQPETYGPFTTDFSEALEGSLYDPAGTGNGVIAGQLYANFKLNDETDLTGAFMYLVPEDDKLNGNDGGGANLDSAMIFNAGVDYKLMANTNLAAQLNVADKSVMSGSDPDTAYAVMGRLQVTF
jgi:hypothetical protein